MNHSWNSPFFRKKRLVAYSGRGQIYSWLRAHHDEVAARVAAEEITWPALTAEMARHGITGRGEPPTAKAAAPVWRRVRHDVRDKRAADQAARSRPGAIYPSRIPRDWRPQEVQPSPKAAAGEAGEAKPYDPMEQLAHIRRTVGERGGRKQ